MNKYFLSAALALVLGSGTQVQAQTIIGQWDFENFNTTVGSTAFNQGTTSAAGTTLNAINASAGNGSATGFHTSAATAWSTPAGNGSANALSANTWAAGDYYQFQVSTLGFSNITLNYDQNGSNTGPLNFKLSYSTDGSNFTDFTTYTVPNNSGTALVWSAGTPTPASTLSFDLSSVDNLADTSTVYFRVIDISTTAINGLGVGTAGTDRLDNFTVNGTSVSSTPEPSTWALSFLGLGLLALFRYRKALSAGR